MDKKKQIDVNSIEAGLRELKGIQSAKIIAKNEGISQIHIVTSQEAQPKEIASQVKTFLLVRFGIGLEERTILFVATLNSR